VGTYAVELEIDLFGRWSETVVGTEFLDDGHIVQFYGHDAELADKVADYLLGALDRDGVAIVIATPEHRDAFEARLTKAGAGLDAARERGSYVALDARATVTEFSAADRLDPAAFDRVVGGLIRRAGAGGRVVRAYGEMVALLWDDGLVNEAAQLEQLWDGLGRELAFSLFCGYRADSVTRPGRAGALAEVCRVHEQIVGDPPDPVAEAVAEAALAGAPIAHPGAVRTFPFSREAPATARHFVVSALHDWGMADVAEDAALVVTELAANAIVHAHSAFTVVLSARGGVVRVSVRDCRALPPGDPSSVLIPVPLHGLGAVDALAGRWGVESLGSAGKTVWVELHR
jgi:MEDS: MEthanogen/methylotroph, DcmR Sensory domain